MIEKLYKFPVPGLKGGFGYFHSLEWHQEVVIIDTEKFFKKWLEEEIAQNECSTFSELVDLYNENSAFMGGDDNPISPLHTSREDAITRLNKHYENHKRPFEITLVAYRDSQWAIDGNTTIDFLNGRHRLINHFKAGALAIPVQMTLIDGTDKFKELYEFQGDPKIVITDWKANQFGACPDLKI